MRGIYKISNNKNNKVYIGESLNINRRWEEHIEDLNSNKHHSDTLQRDWSLYGQNNFKFEIIEKLCEDINDYIGKFVLMVYEDKYIRQYNSLENGYNCEYSLEKIQSGEKSIHGNYINVNERDKGIMKTVIKNINKHNGVYAVNEKVKNEFLIMNMPNTEPFVERDIDNQIIKRTFKCLIHEILQEGYLIYGTYNSIFSLFRDNEIFEYKIIDSKKCNYAKDEYIEKKYFYNKEKYFEGGLVKNSIWVSNQGKQFVIDTLKKLNILC